MKEIFFLRHAVALERESCEGPDSERPLTKEGQQKMLGEVKGMKRLSLAFDVVMSSPFTRALETARIVQAHLPHPGEIEIMSELTPGGSLRALLKILKKRNEKRFLLVGHEPSMSSWIQTLLGVQEGSSVPMKKGALCQINWNPEGLPRSELIFHLPPKVLRQMGS